MTPTSPLDPAYVGDAHALLAAMRADDDEEIRRAYRRVFASPEGRLILAHQAQMAGVGSIRPPGLNSDNRAELDGQANHALRILDLAGFDAASAAVMVMTDTLEGREDERSSYRNDEPDGNDWADPNPDL